MIGWHRGPLRVEVHLRELLRPSFRPWLVENGVAFVFSVGTASPVAGERLVEVELLIEMAPALVARLGRHWPRRWMI